MSQSFNWVKVCEEFDFFRAELLKNFLIQEHEIDAVVVNKQISGYNIGRFEIHVLEENRTSAVELIEIFGKTSV